MKSNWKLISKRRTRRRTFAILKVAEKYSNKESHSENIEGFIFRTESTLTSRQWNPVSGRPTAHTCAPFVVKSIEPATDSEPMKPWYILGKLLYEFRPFLSICLYVITFRFWLAIKKFKTAISNCYEKSDKSTSYASPFTENSSINVHMRVVRQRFSTSVSWPFTPGNYLSAIHHHLLFSIRKVFTNHPNNWSVFFCW